MANPDRFACSTLNCPPVTQPPATNNRNVIVGSNDSGIVITGDGNRIDINHPDRQSEGSYPSIHMSLGGQHQGWGGTDTITINLQNEGFCPVQLMNCSVHWETIDGSARYELKPNMQIRWVQQTPRQNGCDNFVLPKMLKPGYTIKISFNLTPQDIQVSGIDISKYVESGNELMASSLIYQAFAKVRTESKHVMSGSISFSYLRDRYERFSVLLERKDKIND